MSLLQSLCRFAEEQNIYPGEGYQHSPSTHELSPLRDRSVMSGSLHSTDRLSSFSDDGRSDHMLVRSSSREDDEEKQKLAWKIHLVPRFLGYGAGAFCFLSNSGRRREEGGEM